MTHRYLPHTPADVSEMLQTIGISQVAALFSSIPENLRVLSELAIPAGIDEIAIRRHLTEISGQNQGRLHFCGGGNYSHYIPAAIDPLLQRGEFFTCYTPYQPEISQGTLQALYEYQSMICYLTGLPVANASMYDGATAMVEAALMAVRASKRQEILCARTVPPQYRQVLETYLSGSDVTLKELPFDPDTGRLDLKALAEIASDKIAGLIVASPNYFGIIEELDLISDILAAQGIIYIVSISEPLSLGVLKPPADFKADVVCGEAQSFGIPLNYGGPGLGFFACKTRFLRDMPGRIVGRTKDLEGKEGYVLTLATREQHIKRERATSNICSNHGLCALACTIYLSLLGKKGLFTLAETNAKITRWALDQISSRTELKPRFLGPVFNEVVFTGPGDIEALYHKIIAKGVVPGILLNTDYQELPNTLLLNFTELHTLKDIETLINFIQEK